MARSQSAKCLLHCFSPRIVPPERRCSQLLEGLDRPSHYASADEPTLRDRVWLEPQWDLARLKARDGRKGAVLVLDELQKIADWSDAAKLLWDGDSQTKLPLKVVVLGSSPLLIQRGLRESLAGRFEVIALPHRSFAEMQTAFGWNLEQFIYFGGYPGSAPLIEEPERWKRYIIDWLIETTISRDILLLTRVDKPALLRRLFHLACAYSGQVLSYQKMLGQLVDAGNAGVIGVRVATRELSPGGASSEGRRAAARGNCRRPPRAHFAVSGAEGGRAGVRIFSCSLGLSWKSAALST